MIAPADDPISRNSAGANWPFSHSAFLTFGTLLLSSFEQYRVRPKIERDHFSQTFGRLRDILQNPGISRQKVWLPSVSKDIPNFLASTSSIPSTGVTQWKLLLHLAGPMSRGSFSKVNRGILDDRWFRISFWGDSSSHRSNMTTVIAKYLPDFPLAASEVWAPYVIVPTPSPMVLRKRAPWDPFGLSTTNARQNHHNIANQLQNSCMWQTEKEQISAVAPAHVSMSHPDHRLWETDLLPLLVLTRRGAAPVKTSTGNNFPRKYQRIPRNYYQYWC